MVLTRLFPRRKAAQPVVHAIPEGRRVYAVGDVHGCADLFDALLGKIAADNADRDAADVSIILLGDLVDRGPASRRVIERAMALRDEWDDVRLLIGNHEDVFLKSLSGDAKAVRYFVRIGGGPTIHSYGLVGDEYDRLSFEELAEAWPALVPAEHAGFLESGHDSIVIGDYAFVHAGIRPGVPIEVQTSGDLRWIRDEFLEDGRDHGKMVVHGHTIYDDVQERPNRIGIDTGAYATGRLTAIGLEGSARWFIDTAE
jgi:serine/threonine protein phosphatase 1